MLSITKNVMKKNVIFVAIVMNSLLSCCILPMHAMDDQQRPEEQTETIASLLNNEELTKIFRKPISELHNQWTQEKTMYATLLNSINSAAPCIFIYQS